MAIDFRMPMERTELKDSMAARFCDDGGRQRSIVSGLLMFLLLKVR